MADRRRRRRIKSDEDSEEGSSESDVEQAEISENSASQPKKKEVDKPESEYESAEEEEEDGNETSPEKTVKEDSIPAVEVGEEDIILPTELIDEEGGEEGIAEPEDVEGEFLGEELLDGSDVEAEGDEEEEELDEEAVEEERQQGDGEECSPAEEKQLDFDEDRRYPQYIPKKGTFYEHDDRNLSEMPKEKEVEPVRDKKKKKLWLDEGKWGHDRYREEEQTPKSTDELIEAYGYDIRCEDSAPRARRRRRYGRGPTKYDRSWQDETAYAKEQVYGIFQRTPRGARRGRGGRENRARGFRGGSVYRSTNQKISRSESCELKEDNSTITKSTEELKDSHTSDWEPEISEIKVVPKEVIAPIVKENAIIVTNEDFPALVPKEPFSNSLPIQTNSLEFHNDKPVALTLDDDSRNGNNSVRTITFENSNLNNQPKSPMVYEQPPRQQKNLPYREPYRGAYKRPPRIMRGKRGVGRGRGGREHYQRPNLAPRLMEKQVRAINSEIDRLTLHDRNDSFDEQDDSNLEHETIPPPKMNGVKHLNGQSSKNEDSSMRPKRYSSLRQRSLPETQNFQTAPAVAAQHPTFYEAGYQAAMYAAENVVPPTNSQPQATSSPPVINPPQYQYNHGAYPESFALRLPVSNLNNSPRLYPQVTLPTGPPLIGPAPCMAANPNLINYPPPAPPPATPYPQFTYQQYPAPPPAPPVSQQPDLYTSGITYYYPQNQQPAIRVVPQKRPKAAIPIVPPPEVERKFIEKKENYVLENHRRNSISCTEDLSNAEDVVVRTDSSTPQPEIEVES